MKKILMVFAFLVTYLLAKEYPVLSLGVERVSGSHIGSWERDKFLNALERELSRRGHIKLARRAPFLIEVDISGYSKNFSQDTGKFLGSKQYRFKQTVKLKAKYWVFDRRGRELYHGTLPYNVRMDTGSSISYADAMKKARKSMLYGLGERVGSRINDRFHFMVDFEDQMDEQYGKPKRDKQSSRTSYHKSGSVRIASNNTVDFEKRKAGKKISKSDLQWKALPGKNDMHFFTPLNKARFAIVQGKSYKHIDKNYVKRQKLSGTPITAFDFDRTLTKGTVIVFKTTEGHYGKMKILGFKSKGVVKHYYLRVEWKLF